MILIKKKKENHGPEQVRFCIHQATEIHTNHQFYFTLPKPYINVKKVKMHVLRKRSQSKMKLAID